MPMVAKSWTKLDKRRNVDRIDIKAGDARPPATGRAPCPKETAGEQGRGARKGGTAGLRRAVGCQVSGVWRPARPALPDAERGRNPAGPPARDSEAAAEAVNWRW